MYKAKAVGGSREEARRRAEEALKERLWRECWKDEIELQGAREEQRELVDGKFEVTLEI